MSRPANSITARSDISVACALGALVPYLRVENAHAEGVATLADRQLLHANFIFDEKLIHAKDMQEKHKLSGRRA